MRKSDQQIHGLLNEQALLIEEEAEDRPGSAKERVLERNQLPSTDGRYGPQPGILSQIRVWRRRPARMRAPKPVRAMRHRTRRSVFDGTGIVEVWVPEFPR